MNKVSKSNHTKVTSNNIKKSLLKVQHKIITFAELWDNYPKDKIEHTDPNTHKDLYDNHCAINMSQCFYKSGITMKSFTGTRCKHCPEGTSVHALGAEQLAAWLKTKPFPGCPQAIQCTGKNYKEKLDGKNGIVCFQNYWQRENEKGTNKRSGDHIDLWKDGVLAGQAWIVSIVRISIGFSWDGWMSDYGLSNKVLFWEIK